MLVTAEKPVDPASQPRFRPTRANTLLWPETSGSLDFAAAIGAPITGSVSGSQGRHGRFTRPEAPGCSCCPQLVRDEMPEAAGAERNAGRPLHHVDVGAVISFDEDRPISRDSDVPANYGTVAERPVRAQGELLYVRPHRHALARDSASGVGMGVEPPEPRVSPEVRGAPEPSAIEVDRRDDAAGVDIVDRAVRTDRHPEHCADNL